MDEVFEFVAGFSIFVWGPVLLVLAVGVALLVRQALREGREVSFWPPKIGSRPSTTIQSGTAEGLGRLDDGQQKGTIRPIKLPTDQVAYLVLTTGDNAGTAWPIKSGQRELQVGRSPSSDIVIGGDFSVSGAHFKIYVHPVSGARSREYQLFIHDTGSINGTFLNGHRIGYEPYEVTTNDIIEAGGSTFMLHFTFGAPIEMENTSRDDRTVLRPK